MNLSFAHLSLFAALIVGTAAPTIIAASDEVSLPQAVFSAPQMIFFPGQASISIKRDDTVGDDDYTVHNATGRALVNLKIMYLNKVQGTHAYLAAGDTITFHDIPDEWFVKDDEKNVTLQYVVETKSLAEARAEVTKQATDAFPLPKGTNVPLDFHAAMIQAVKHAAEEEAKWSVKTGILLRSNKWGTFLKKIE